MQWIVKKIGWLLQISMGTTAAESMNAAGNIFLGQVKLNYYLFPVYLLICWLTGFFLLIDRGPFVN